MSTSAPDDLAEDHRQALKRLREMAMNLAQRLHASADEPEADLGAVASTFARVARAVRQTIFLEARLADDERRRAEAAEREEEAMTGGFTPDDAPWWVTLRMDCAESGREAEVRKLDSVKLVQRAIAKAPDDVRARVQERLLDALDEDKFDVVFSDREPEWVIAHICRDLGLAPDWAAFSDRDWGKTPPEVREGLIADPLKGMAKLLPPVPPYPPPEAFPSDPAHPDHYRRRGPPRAWNA